MDLHKFKSRRDKAPLFHLQAVSSHFILGILVIHYNALRRPWRGCMPAEGSWGEKGMQMPHKMTGTYYTYVYSSWFNTRYITRCQPKLQVEKFILLAKMMGNHLDSMNDINIRVDDNSKLQTQIMWNTKYEYLLPKNEKNRNDNNSFYFAINDM